ncbi:DUF4822 domain-containing protein [Ignatzschineria sp. LJL83]
MIKMKNIIAVALMGSVLAACATKDLNEHEKVMVGKTWVTTNAIDHNIRSIGANDSRVSQYYGTANYYRNGKFVMHTPEGVQKLQGDWSISEDGKTRTLVAKDKDGKVLFTRDVENTSVTPTDYVYRLYPSQYNKNQYIDILHQPQKR